MAAVAVEECPGEEHMRDRALRALHFAVVSGFVKDYRATQESCLGLCNACREGVPVERMLIGEGVPQTRVAMVFPSVVQAQREAEIPPTRVLQPRRVLRLKWTFRTNAWWTESTEEIPNSPVGASSVGNVDLSEVQWPEGIKEVHLLSFDEEVEGVAWPKGLECLSFCALRLRCGPSGFANRGSFNRSLVGANFPSGLREIFLGDAFDQPIEDVVWPHGLERLSLPGCNQPIDNVRWPPALKSLEFSPPSQICLREDPNTRLDVLELHRDRFNSRFTNLPASLEALWLGNNFCQSLEGVNWPSGLVTLGLGSSFTGLNGGVSWPPNLQNLYLVNEMDWLEYPKSCIVTIVKDYDTESQSFDAERDGFDDLDHDFYDPDLDDGYEDCFEGGDDDDGSCVI
ncbi:unnamed protein product [Ectocarpus sp. 12 AP-2014]